MARGDDSIWAYNLPETIEKKEKRLPPQTEKGEQPEKKAEERTSLYEILTDNDFQRIGKNTYAKERIVIQFLEGQADIMFGYDLSSIEQAVNIKSLDAGGRKELEEKVRSYKGLISAVNIHMKGAGLEPGPHPYNYKKRRLLFEGSMHYEMSKKGIENVIETASRIFQNENKYITGQLERDNIPPIAGSQLYGILLGLPAKKIL